VVIQWGGRDSNPRPTDYESLDTGRATRRNDWLEPGISPAVQQIWPLPVRSRYVVGTVTNRPRTPRLRRDATGTELLATRLARRFRGTRDREVLDGHRPGCGIPTELKPPIGHAASYSAPCPAFPAIDVRIAGVPADPSRYGPSTMRRTQTVAESGNPRHAGRAWSAILRRWWCDSTWSSLIAWRDLCRSERIFSSGLSSASGVGAKSDVHIRAPQALKGKAAAFARRLPGDRRRCVCHKANVGSYCRNIERF
jgi:hypothetical protein